MKKSLFNFYYQRSSEEYVLYNTFSKAILVLNEKEFNEFEHHSIFSLPNDGNEDFKTLLANGFFVNDDFSELTFLKYFHYKTKFSKEQLSLTIAPTLDCNFACPYCYENPRKGKMCLDVQNKLLTYIEQKVKEGVKILEITWYGGEPLLYPDIVDYLSTEISTIAKKYGITLGMSLVTNGFLVNSNTVEMLVRNDISSVQITLDGLESNHNQRRFLRNGKETFTEIVRNLSFFEQSNIKVNIRMNVDQYNFMDFPALKKLINSYSGINIGLYPSAVENLNEREKSRLSNYMTSEEYENFIVESHKNNQLEEGGLDIIDNRRYFCSAELENSYVVDELGNFYKCWDDIGDISSVCFNVLDEEKIDHKQIAKYIAADPFSDEKCSKCKFLPLCFGGCRFQRNKLNKSVCNFSDETMRLFLESKYF